MEFNRLKLEDENKYFITSKRNFQSIYDLSDKVNEVFDFAYGMTFGKKGQHRENRSNGDARRKNGEIFINAFQGKLAEFGTHKYFSNICYLLKEPELQIWGKGKWDDVDLQIGDKKINIKSVVHFSNLLLLEKEDWDENGLYVPNINKEIGSKYDFFILTRLMPDGKSVMRNSKLFYSDYVDEDVLRNIILSNKWIFDIAGFIKNSEIKKIIKDKYIIPKKSLLNGKIQMDTDNYYCQAGDMHPINEIINELTIPKNKFQLNIFH